MKPVKYNLNNTNNSIDRFFDDFFNNSLHHFMGSDVLSTTPAINIVERDEAFHIELATPGLKKEDLNIQIDQDTLTIEAYEAHQEEETNDKFLRREFQYGVFKRTYAVPETIDTNKIGASYENGVLHITLPKKEEAKLLPARKIEIN